MTRPINCPRLTAEDHDIRSLCQIYRVLDNIEETANMAHQYLHQINGGDTTASTYIDALQEFLSAERISVVSELCKRPASDDADGRRRLAVILQYEAWCEEFRGDTVHQFVNSVFVKEAV
ncbi:hypothetical protein [Sinorhizobium sp. RAC02]|uniref:hypothetical protein n=1 Tax=Sinorhizobium sp. RAC02 TaxID=1842534 RepID=UPI00083D210A|nr:hypothetical protein [Sinorhizobium sp. RAC02]AOF90110.1 hypothetical protein BSY16_3978 [Sinorhizobium sp. RAC02]